MVSTLTFPLRWMAGLLCLWISVILAAPLSAHSTNQSYVYFNVTDADVSGRIEVTTNDLARVFAPDADDMSEQQVLTLLSEIFAYFQERLSLSHKGSQLPFSFTEISFLPTESGNFAQLQFDVEGIKSTPDNIVVGYDFLFSDIDPEHRGFGLIESNTLTGLKDNESYISVVFNAGDAPKTLKLSGDPAGQVALQYFEDGVWHVWLGLDHVVFWLALLASLVMTLQAGRWVAAPDLGESLSQSMTLVGLFVAAHTICLTIAAYDFLRIPSALAEACIMIAIVLVALGNLVPRYHVRAWKLVLFVSVVHGLGFAEILAALDLQPANKAIALVSFNIGVLSGLLAIVLVVFPILYVLRNRSAYGLMVMRGGAIACIAMALLWFVNQTFEVFTPAHASANAVET